MNKKGLLAGLLLGASAIPVSAGDMIERIEPPYWWTGMKNDTLQLMVSGPDIASAKVTVDYPGVQLIEDVDEVSPDYKILYLKIADNTRPGEMKLHFEAGELSEIVNYELRARKSPGEAHTGFDAGDVLYLLMPDRFAEGKAASSDPYAGLEYKAMPDRDNPNARHGGNIAGIREHLDYIEDLGVTAVWVCPVLENDMPGGSYHGYATTDYYRIDPRFGTNDEWAEFIAEAQKRGIKVVMDMIFNHSGSAHRWLENMPMEDWYNHPEGDVMTNFRLTTVHDPYASDYDKDATVNGWFVRSMPDLNQRNPHLMKYLTQNSIWWIESSGINGIRMDTYPYADMQGMASWARDVMAEYPNFNIVGECWYGNEAGSAFWQDGSRVNPQRTELPTVMDFKLVIDGHKMFDEETTPWTGLNNLYDHLSNDFLYADPQRVLTFLDNHDTDRFLLQEPDSLDVWRQAVTFLLTSRGIPQIYYGTELLMNGSKEGCDGFVRRDMPGGFEGDTVNAFTREGRTELQNEALDYLSGLLHWRKGEANAVIAKGSLKHFMPINCAYVYERRLGDKQIVVLINGTDDVMDLEMARYAEILPAGTKMHRSLGGEDVEITDTLRLAPRETLLLQNF
ncbi:MAG: glycoside hydrolase family 13 protein [Muribaculaceae bacterium]|nr:glycoside hydrolase family 13 protein [Muribaculaceae bacterium]